MTPLEDVEAAQERAAFIEELGKIGHLLADPTVMNVSLNEPERRGGMGPVFVDRANIGYRREVGADMSKEEAETLIRIVASHTNQLLDKRNPNMSCQAANGEFRIEAELPFATRRAPVFTIRVYTVRRLRLNAYVEAGEMTAAQALALVQAVQSRQTILIAGETGGGKTTLLNALLYEAARDGSRRVLTIEDTPELECPNELSVQLVVRRDSPFDYQHAVQSALRHNPDLIALGEIRTGEAAYEALDAWQTGHPGMGTLHASSAARMPWRLLSLLRKTEAGRLVTGDDLAHAVNVLVHVSRVSGRRVFDLRRVTGFVDGEFQTVAL